MKYLEAKPYLKVGMKINSGLFGSGSTWQGERCINEKIIHVFENKIETIHFNIWLSCDSDLDIEILTLEDGVTPWKDPREREEKPKWKAGQKVRATINCSGSIAGRIYELEDKLGNEYGTETQLKGTHCHCGQGWELVEEPVKEECAPFIVTSEPDVSYTMGWHGEKVEYQPKSFTRKESKMNNVFKSMKAKLSPVDKTLVKHGYLNSDGTRTPVYEDNLRELALNKLIDAEDTETVRKELAKELKEQE